MELSEEEVGGGRRIEQLEGGGWRVCWSSGKGKDKRRRESHLGNRWGYAYIWC